MGHTIGLPMVVGISVVSFDLLSYLVALIILTIDNNHLVIILLNYLILTYWDY